MDDRGLWAIGGLVVVFFLLLIGACTAYPLALRSTAHYETLIVDEKERGSDNNPYLVYGKDETYSVEDSLSFFTFNSSDRWAALDEGKAYRCKVAGWRIPALSAYKNIIGPCEEIDRNIPLPEAG